MEEHDLPAGTTISWDTSSPVFVAAAINSHRHYCSCCREFGIMGCASRPACWAVAPLLPLCSPVFNNRRPLLLITLQSRSSFHGAAIDRQERRRGQTFRCLFPNFEVLSLSRLEFIKCCCEFCVELRVYRCCFFAHSIAIGTTRWGAATRPPAFVHIATSRQEVVNFVSENWRHQQI